MPRYARLDAPGAMHHVMARGLEGRDLFRDDEDRRLFVELAGKVCRETGSRCLAWALMPNHIHLLLQSATSPLSVPMKRILGGHAQRFNRRHRRAGPVFQGRFKSVLVEDEAYFCELVRYIHLNPVRGGLVVNIDALDRFPWSGHRELVGAAQEGLCDVAVTMAWFGTEGESQQAALREWMVGGLTSEAGAGSPASASSPPTASAEAIQRVSEARQTAGVLGTAAFEADALERAGDARAHQARHAAAGWDLGRLIVAVCTAVGANAADVRTGRRTARASEARAAIAWLARTELGVSGATLADALGVSSTAISHCLTRGRKAADGLRLTVSGLAAGERS